MSTSRVAGLLIAVAFAAAACGPNAALVGTAPSPTAAPAAAGLPVRWTTATAIPTRFPQPTPLPATRPAAGQPATAPTSTAAPNVQTPALLAPPPTASVARSPLPTPTPRPPIQCQFSSGNVSLPLPFFHGATPTLVPAQANWTIAATGEAMPGLTVELRVPSTSIVAGALATAQFVVRNTSAEEVTLSASLTFERSAAAISKTPDPREFRLMPRTGPPGARDPRVPAGQTHSAFTTTPLPFDASGTISLHALARISRGNPVYPQPFTTLVADIPLRISPTTPADELHLELNADAQQWCLHATEAGGAPVKGPLFVSMQVSIPRGVSLMAPDVLPVTNDTWAERWSNPSPPPFTQTVWVGGPHYATGRAEVTVN